MAIKVLVNGAYGKMGRIAVEAVNGAEDLTLVGQTGRQDDLSQAIKASKPDVVIDFTIPQSIFANAQIIIQEGVRPVIGTTGFTSAQMSLLENECEKNKLGGLIVPNFSLGAVLMMKFAQETAKYLPDVEIIEMHHPQKLDAPSGTAIKTAAMIAAHRVKAPASSASDSKARGEIHHGVPIHSIRLPGFFSHQTVVFGNIGEIFTISHQGIDRQCCAPGIQLACRQVVSLNRLVYGLENLLFD